MDGDIKGITIEFRGNAKPLQKAIRTVDSELKKTTKELSSINKALKFNPGSVDLWRQKQQLLSEKVKETTDKLEALKAAQKQMDAAGVDKNSAEYRKLQREIIETNSQLKTFKSQLSAVGNVNLRAISEQIKQAGSALESAGQSLRGVSTAAGIAVGAIGALTVKSAAWADDINTLSKRYSIGTQDLQKYGAAAQLVDVDVEAIAKTHTRLEKSMFSAAQGTGANAEAFEKLGVSVTNTDGSLRDGDAVWQETIKALGSMTNETERDALAMQLMGRSANELNPLIEDGGETYQQLAETLEKYDLNFIDQETLDKANQFNDEIDTIKAIGLVAFQSIGTTLAGYLAPALEQVVGWVGRFAEWLVNLDPRLLTIITTVLGVVAVLSPLLIGLGKISFAISSIMSLMATLGPAIGALGSGALLPIIAIIAGVIAIGVALYNNWDTIKAKAIAFKDMVVSTFNAFKAQVTAQFNAIKTAIVTPIQNAINTVKSIIDRVKGWFPISIGKIFSNIKLPHFKLSGSFSLTKMTVPKLSVDWYAQGGIFNSPTIAGIGEIPGGEAVVPLNKFWDKLDNLNAGETNIVININGANRDPIEIADEVKRMLIRETNQRRLAWQ